MATHPQISEMLQHPYGVLSSYTDPDGQVYKGVYATAVKNTVPTFQEHFNFTFDNILLAAAKSERGKETRYIDKFIESISKELKDYNLYADLITLFNQLKTPMTDKNKPLNSFSKIMDTIQKIQMELYDITKSLEENEKIFKEFNKLAATEPISKSLREALGAKGPLTKLEFGKIDKNLTGEDIIKKTMDIYRQKIDEAAKDNNFTDKQVEVLKQLAEVYTIKLREFYENKMSSVTTDPLYKTLEKVEQDAIEYDKKKKRNKDKILVSGSGKNKTMYQVVWDAINGSLGGKGVEYTIDLAGGGRNTGPVQDAKGRDIDADNMQLASGELQLYYGASEDLFQKVDEAIKFDDLKKELSAINELSRRFIIMTSAKDQSTNAKFIDFHARSETVKIKGDASLASRKTEIEKIYGAVGGVGHNPSDLVFSIANLAQDFVCSGQKEQARRVLGTLCMIWMFDDAEEIVEGTQFITGSDSLHFYNLNGKYYTLSDILELTAQDISRKSKLKDFTSSNADNMKYVRVNITVPSSNPYEVMLKREGHPPPGMEQWDEVSNVLNKTTQIEIRMTVQNLFNDLFGNIMGI